MTDSEIVIEGPADTSKTTAILYRLHNLALEYPLQALITRKIYADLHRTVLRTYERKILTPGSPVQIYGGKRAQWYDYTESGARIWIAGLDKASSELSAEYDIVYGNQAEEYTLENWETLTARATGRAGNLPFAATWGDANPSGAQNYLLARARTGKLKLLHSQHRDNPALYDEAGNVTAEGVKRLQKLADLTGVRRQRLYEGQWVTPEGVVYGEFDRNIHVKTRAKDEFQYRVLVLDAGFDNPAVTLVVAIDADLRLHIEQEFYESGVLPSRHANATLRMARMYHAGLAVCDPSAAGLIAELRNVGLQVETPQIRDVERGIDLVHELLAVQKDKQPRLTVDPGCVNVINEFESYRREKGRIVKKDDHCADCVRYLAMFLWGDIFETEEVVYDPIRMDSRW